MTLFIDKIELKHLLFHFTTVHFSYSILLVVVNLCVKMKHKFERDNELDMSGVERRELQIWQWF